MAFTGAFPWRGGKSKLAPEIMPYFPRHECYVEPFFGSGSMFFARKDRSKIEAINDLNSDIATFFQVIREQPDKFCEGLNLYPHSRDDFNYLKSLDPETLSPLDRALQFYVLQIRSFSGGGNSFSGGTASLKHPPVKTDYSIDQIKRFSNRLLDVWIENKPFEYMLDTYDAKHSFFYLDPPYHETSGYSVGSFPVSGYEHIAKFMMSQEGKTALSINDHPFIRELFKDFEIVQFPIKYSCKKAEATEASELLIMNYKTDRKQMDLF